GLALALYRAAPRRTRGLLLEGLESPFVIDQITFAWIVSATGDPYFRRPLLRFLRAPVPVQPLQLAALAGLERIADPRTRGALMRASQASDYQVREFARRALEALPPVMSAKRPRDCA